MPNSIANFDYYARWTYDQFRLLQPHVQTQGLWKVGNRYFIKCESLSIQPLGRDDHKSLSEHFNHSVRPAGTPIELCEIVPDGGILMSERSQEEISSDHGSPMTLLQTNLALASELHPTFPLEWITADGPTIIIQVTRPLDSIESTHLDTIMNHLNAVPNYRIEVVNANSSLQVNAMPDIKVDNLTQIPSRYIRPNISHDLRLALQSDEQMWVAHRNQILVGNSSLDGIIPVLPDKESRCLVNAQVVDPFDIRNYLSLFDVVYVVAPLSDKYASCLSGLGVSEDELVQLIGLGRVRLLCPQPVTRYDFRLLERALDAHPNAVIFSRALSAMTIIDSRLRNPLLYPSLTISERATIMKAMMGAANEGPKELRGLYELLVGELSQIWSSMEGLVNARGAMATSALGSGRIIGALIQGLTKRNVQLEILAASMSTDWAGAIKGTLCPIGDQAIIDNEVRLANIISGSRVGGKLELLENANIAVQDILTVGDHVPVIEFAQAFSSSEINRFRQLVRKMSEHNATIDELQDSAAHFNQEVIRYDYSSAHLSRWDIQGVVFEGLLESTDHNFAFSRLILEVIKIAIEHAARHSNSAHEIQDRLVAFCADTSPDAVLVSRMNRKLRDRIY